MRYIVKVGAVENPNPEYQDMCGFNYHGPMSAKAALDFKADVLVLWAERADEEFVYGQPEVEVIALCDNWTPERAADNWYLSISED